MKKKKLIKFLKEDGRCLFNIGRYIIPTYYKTRNRCTINLKANRDKALIENASNWSKFFDLMVKRLYSNYVVYKEFPLVIEDYSRWESCCDRYGISDKEQRGRNYFLADYIFPDYNLIVEIDSNLHDFDYDKARDDYIKSTWGFKILRFYEFGSSPGSMDMYLDQLDLVLANKPSDVINLDYSDLIIKSFVHAFGPTTLKAINKVEKYIYRKRVPKGVQLSCDGILNFLELYSLNFYEERMKVLQFYFKYTYNIDVIVTPSNP